jgi:hypothetical protein
MAQLLAHTMRRYSASPRTAKPRVSSRVASSSSQQSSLSEEDFRPGIMAASSAMKSTADNDGTRSARATAMPAVWIGWPEADTPVPESDSTGSVQREGSAERWRFLVAPALLTLGHFSRDQGDQTIEPFGVGRPLRASGAAARVRHQGLKVQLPVAEVEAVLWGTARRRSSRRPMR